MNLSRKQDAEAGLLKKAGSLSQKYLQRVWNRIGRLSRTKTSHMLRVILTFTLDITIYQPTIGPRNRGRKR